jgi:dTDP-4-amino-4,6-dideoxygalactose transaminase
VSSLGPYKITIVDLRAQHGKIREEVRMAIDEVTDSQQFTLGPVVKRFEEQMAQYLQCSFAIGYKKGDFPQAELAAGQVLALPLYPELTPAQQESVVENIQAFFRR